jgi:hypothetical protein
MASAVFLSKSDQPVARPAPPANSFAVTSTGGFFSASDARAREEALAVLRESISLADGSAVWS